MITEELFPVKISFDKAHLFFSNPVKVFGLSIRGVFVGQKKRVMMLCKSKAEVKLIHFLKLRAWPKPHITKAAMLGHTLGTSRSTPTLGWKAQTSSNRLTSLQASRDLFFPMAFLLFLLSAVDIYICHNWPGNPFQQWRAARANPSVYKAQHSPLLSFN